MEGYYSVIRGLLHYLSALAEAETLITLQT